MLYQWPQITPRKRSNGSTAHMAQITIKRNGKDRSPREQDIQTANRRPLHGHMSERKALKVPGALDQLPNAHATLATAIDRYVSTSVKEIGRTKAQVLRTIKTFPIADLLCSEIHSPDVIELATALGKNTHTSDSCKTICHTLAPCSLSRAPHGGYPLDDQVVRERVPRFQADGNYWEVGTPRSSPDTGRT